MTTEASSRVIIIRNWPIPSLEAAESDRDSRFKKNSLHSNFPLTLRHFVLHSTIVRNLRLIFMAADILVFNAFVIFISRLGSHRKIRQLDTVCCLSFLRILTAKMTLLSAPWTGSMIGCQWTKLGTWKLNEPFRIITIHFLRVSFVIVSCFRLAPSSFPVPLFRCHFVMLIYVFSKVKRSFTT